MDRFGIFYCDIYGTYLQKNMLIKDGQMGFYSNPGDSHFSAEKVSRERVLNLFHFAELLDILCDVDDLDKLYFSFGSTSSKEDVKACIDEIKPYLGRYSRLKFGTSFTEHEKFIGTEIEPCHTVGKPMQIFNNIHKHIIGELHPNEKFVKYYFADDSKINHIMLKEIVGRTEARVDSTHFVLGINGGFGNSVCNQNKNISGLIDTLEVYCIEKSSAVSL